jgi:hypothetical protein
MSANQAHVLEIVIANDGSISSTVKGVAGPDCSKLSQWLDEMGTVTKDTHTNDWNKDKDQRVYRINR